MFVKPEINEIKQKMGSHNNTITLFYTFTRKCLRYTDISPLIIQFFCLMLVLECAACGSLDYSTKKSVTDNRLINNVNRINNIYTSSKSFHTTGSTSHQDSNVVGSASVWLPWSGASCGIQNCSSSFNKTTVYSAPYYACSNGIGQWNNGVQFFLDPVPQGYEISYANITFAGSFFCDTQLAQTTFFLELNGKHFLVVLTC